MKSMARAVLFGGFILATQAALADGSAFPSATDDAGVYLPPRVSRASDWVGSAVSAFPSSADDAGVYLTARTTHADAHADARVAAVDAFPSAADEAGVHLPARATYADSHPASPVHAYGSVQGADIGAN
jgi:hypothetical protein